MPELIEVLSAADIKTKVSDIAKIISSDYKNSTLVLIGALKGSFIFLADLARALSIPTQIGFIGVSSYGESTQTSGKINVTKELDVSVEGKDVLIVEDIVDTGLTLEFIVNYLNSYNPTSVKVCTLINKTERRMVDVTVDYLCHLIPEGFLVGYGLDHAENYRYLSAIYHLKSRSGDTK